MSVYQSSINAGWPTCLTFSTAAQWVGGPSYQNTHVTWDFIHWMFLGAENGLVLKLLVTYMVGVGKWILPGFDQGLQFSGCYLFTLRVDATESLIRKEYSPIICTTRPSLPPPPDFILLVSQFTESRG
ncbi:hypothetical protein H0E87_018635 [Populus deltoides]|uniref:Uncharacterized protein n=1 Tax=Populus deltoides TaxID=3696 RepID=A0A8T2XR35_POPDE|nr:hypothetical protein H0E87_018635 [Populus deltoides]